jgi:hypothetical protein
VLHGVLLECGRWAKSASVLHAAVDCLRQMLKLTSSGEQRTGCEWPGEGRPRRKLSGGRLAGRQRLERALAVLLFSPPNR